MIEPKKNAIGTEMNMPNITSIAFSVFIRSPSPNPVWSPCIFIMANMVVPPRSSNTIETVVEVGSPRLLNMSSRITSEIITDRKMNISSLKENIAGWKIPCLAISIIPLLIVAPMKTPTAATMIIVLNDATLAPMAELRKFTASLLTPTIRSTTASEKRNSTKKRNMLIFSNLLDIKLLCLNTLQNS